MDLRQHLLRVLLLRFDHRGKRVEKSLVVAGGKQATLDAEYLERSGEAKAVHQYADRADDARLVDVDPVRSGSHVVAARSTDVLDDRVERNVRVLGAQPPDLVVDVPGLHRAATRAVDAQDHALRALVLERILQSRHDVVGAGLRIGRDDSLQVDQGRVLRRGRLLLAEPSHADEQQREQVDEQQDLEEYAPLSRPSLLLDSRQGDFFDRLTLPARCRPARFQFSHDDHLSEASRDAVFPAPNALCYSRIALHFVTWLTRVAGAILQVRRGAPRTRAGHSRAAPPWRAPRG